MRLEQQLDIREMQAFLLPASFCTEVTNDRHALQDTMSGYVLARMSRLRLQISVAVSPRPCNHVQTVKLCVPV